MISTQLSILTPYEVGKIMIARGVPLSYDISKLLTLEQQSELIESIQNIKLRDLSLRVTKYEVSKMYPVLFRGAHVAELDPKLNLRQIQGRPEDTSYNGNVLHLTSDFTRAIAYAVTNARRDLPDKKVAIMVYDTDILLKYGTNSNEKDVIKSVGFGPGVIDGNVLMTALESLKHCSQVRWYNYHESGQQQRLSALIGIVEIPKCITTPNAYFHINVNAKWFDIAFEDFFMYCQPSNRQLNSCKSKAYKLGRYVLIYGLVYEVMSDVIVVPDEPFNMNNISRYRVGNGCYIPMLNAKYII